MERHRVFFPNDNVTAEQRYFIEVVIEKGKDTQIHVYREFEDTEPIWSGNNTEDMGAALAKDFSEEWNVVIAVGPTSSPPLL